MLLARIPSLSSFLPTAKPGKPRSIRKAVMPRYPASGFALANTMNMSASLALVIQSLRPVSTNSSPTCCARDAIANASLPEPASDKAYAPTLRVAICGQYRRRWSSVPQRRRALMNRVFCTSTKTPTEGSTRDKASTASTAWKNVAPAP